MASDMLDSRPFMAHRYNPTAAERLIVKTVASELDDFEEAQAIVRASNTLGLRSERVKEVWATSERVREVQDARRNR